MRAELTLRLLALRAVFTGRASGLALRRTALGIEKARDWSVGRDKRAKDGREVRSDEAEDGADEDSRRAIGDGAAVRRRGRLIDTSERSIVGGCGSRGARAWW